MKKIIYILLLIPALALAGNPDSAKTEARNYVNTYIVPNAVQSITGTKMNTALNKIINAIAQGDSTYGRLDSLSVNDSTLTALLGDGSTLPVNLGPAIRSLRKVDSLYLFNNSTRDSICAWFSINGRAYRSCAKDSAGDAGLLLDSTEVDYFTVINTINTPPGGPATGATYTVGTSPTGAWAGQANAIAEWNGSSWDFTTPTQGDYYYNQTNGYTFQFRSGAWVRTSSIPVLVNGQSLSAGVTLGTNNPKSLTFETNNVKRGRIDSLGAPYFYAVPAAGGSDTFVVKWNSVTGKFTRVGQSSIGGGSGTNIYNSSGQIDTGVTRHVLVYGGLEMYDPDGYSGLSIGDSFAIPDPGGGEHNHLPMDGVKMTKYYIGGGGSELFDVTYSAGVIPGVILSGNHTYTNFSTNELGGFSLGHPLGTDYAFSTWFHQNPALNESLNFNLNSSGDSAGFILKPYGLDAGDTWKNPYTIRFEDTLQSTIFGLKSDGGAFLNAPHNDAVTYVVGWDASDSTLVRIDKSTLGGATDTSEVATKAYVDAKDAQLSLSKNAGKDSIIIFNGATRLAAKDEGWVLLASASASNSATVEFTIDTTVAYRKLMLDIDDLYPATNNVEMWLRIGFGATPTYASGASDYTSVLAGSVGAGFNLGAAQMKLTQNGSSTYPHDAILQILSPTQTTGKKTIFFRAANHDSGTPTYNYYFTGNGTYNINNRPYSGIQILMSSGNITSGTFYLYGVK